VHGSSVAASASRHPAGHLTGTPAGRTHVTLLPHMPHQPDGIRTFSCGRPCPHRSHCHCGGRLRSSRRHCLYCHQGYASPGLCRRWRCCGPAASCSGSYPRVSAVPQRRVRARSRRVTRSPESRCLKSCPAWAERRLSGKQVPDEGRGEHATPDGYARTAPDSLRSTIWIATSRPLTSPFLPCWARDQAQDAQATSCMALSLCPPRLPPHKRPRAGASHVG
jgi:hypothetical protein